MIIRTQLTMEMRSIQEHSTLRGHGSQKATNRVTIFSCFHKSLSMSCSGLRTAFLSLWSSGLPLCFLRMLRASGRRHIYGMVTMRSCKLRFPVTRFKPENRAAAN